MELTSEERFIETLGLFLESLGFPRIAGRILGLLLSHGSPLHLDQISTRLKVSRASVSTNTRLLVTLLLIREEAIPGDRRTWFVVRPDAFQARLLFIVNQFRALADILQTGLDVVPADPPIARERLLEAVEFHNFMASGMQELSRKWELRSKEAS